MLTLLRSVHVSNMEMHNGKWNRFFGRRLSEITIGIIGVGRIGTGVIRNLKGFGSPKFLANDILNKYSLDQDFNIEWVDQDEIYQQADIVTIHTPLTAQTKNMVKREQLLV